MFLCTALGCNIAFGYLNACTFHGVNQEGWLVDVLTRIDLMAEDELYTLLPQHWMQ
ncbi:MAG: hypothetical protein OXE59_06675 [Bacteroidetes bacterium]|nr:hypothetical protein [Bacteroidota bacterium]